MVQAVRLTGPVQVKVSFMKRHSGSHSMHVLFTSYSRGSLKRQRSMLVKVVYIISDIVIAIIKAQLIAEVEIQYVSCYKIITLAGSRMDVQICAI